MRFTHCELTELSQLSPSSSLIALANHNQAPRNSYMNSMGKQALGRCLKKGGNKELCFPQDPLLTTTAYDLLCMKGQGTGTSMLTAFCAGSQNQEDAVIMKKEFLDRGGLMLTKKTVYKTVLKSTVNAEVLGDGSCGG